MKKKGFTLIELLAVIVILAVIAIVRIPVGMYVPTILLMVWLLQLLSETMRDEAKLKEIENAEEK